MTSKNRHEQLVAWLHNEGHSDADIEKILAKLREYDERTVHESVFDSIERGSFDMAAIIKEALGEDS